MPQAHACPGQSAADAAREVRACRPPHRRPPIGSLAIRAAHPHLRHCARTRPSAWRPQHARPGDLAACATGEVGAAPPSWHAGAVSQFRCLTRVRDRQAMTQGGAAETGIRWPARIPGHPGVMVRYAIVTASGIWQASSCAVLGGVRSGLCRVLAGLAGGGR